MKTSVAIVLALFLSCIAVCDAAGKSQFSDVAVDKQFEPYLLRNPLLMEATGAKVIHDKNDRTILLSVASTVLKNNSPAELLRAEKICRVKALAGMVGEKKGIQVCHVETLNEKTELIIDKNGETGKSVSELIQITQTKAEGIIKDMPVIGHWRSRDGMVYYLAIGVRLNKNGEILEVE